MPSPAASTIAIVGAGVAGAAAAIRLAERGVAVTLYEAVPAPREGFIWAPGHYVWDGSRYLWRPGEWVASRPGWAWQAARWEQRSDGSWHLVSGSWVRTADVAVYRDRDGDGVINRADRFPRDPGRW